MDTFQLAKLEGKNAADEAQANQRRTPTQDNNIGLIKTQKVIIIPKSAAIPHLFLLPVSFVRTEITNRYDKM